MRIPVWRCAMRSSESRSPSSKCTSRTRTRARPCAGARCCRAPRSGASLGSGRTAMNSPCVGWSVISPRMTDLREYRLAALSDGLTASNMDGLLVTGSANVRYLSGFSGSSGLLFVSAHETLLITDFRYQTQAADEVGDLARVVIESQSLWTGLWQQLSQMPYLSTAGFESAHLVHRD